MNKIVSFLIELSPITIMLRARNISFALDRNIRQMTERHNKTLLAEIALHKKTIEKLEKVIKQAGATQFKFKYSLEEAVAEWEKESRTVKIKNGWFSKKIIEVDLLQPYFDQHGQILSSEYLYNSVSKDNVIKWEKATGWLLGEFIEEYSWSLIQRGNLEWMQIAKEQEAVKDAKKLTQLLSDPAVVKALRNALAVSENEEVRK